MTPFAWITLVVIVTAIAAITGLKPRGARPVARTSLMAVARVVLLVLAAIVVYFLYRSRSGGVSGMRLAADSL
jgi:hypothetical protein